MVWQQTENTWASLACTDCGGQGSLLFHHWTGQDRRDSTQSECKLEEKKKRTSHLGNIMQMHQPRRHAFKVSTDHTAYTFFLSEQ